MKPKRLKVLFLTSSYPRDDEDTASVFLKSLAESVSESNIDVHVLAPAHRTGSTTLERGIAVHRFQYFPAAMQRLAYGSGMLPNLRSAPWLWLEVPFFLMAMARSLRRLHAQERFDFLHAHWILPAGLIASLASRRLGLPLIVSAHGTDAFALSRSWQRALKSWVIRESTAWTANTPGTARALSCVASISPPRIIPMGVDIARFSTGRRSRLRAQNSAGEFIVLFVGRLIESKGCQDLLSALALLEPGLRRSTNLWIVGDGERRMELQLLAKELKVEPAVRFTGAVSHKRLPDFYAAADLVVIPSRAGATGEQEGQSVVALEASAARACVLATRIGGIPSFVEHGVTGMLVEPGDPAALAEAIEELLKHPELRARLAAAAFSRLHGRYDWKSIAAAFTELYDDVSGRRRVRHAATQN